MKLDTATLLKKIVAEHEAALRDAVSSVKHVLVCGRLLAALKLQAADWEKQLEAVKLSRTTAWRYIKVANDAAKNPGRTKYLLEQGASLVDLYRAFDLVKPVEQGGYKSDVYQRRKLGEQLELDFSYEEAVPHLRSLIKAKNVEELSESVRRRLLKDCEAAAERLRETLKDDTAINLKDHQP